MVNGVRSRQVRLRVALMRIGWDTQVVVARQKRSCNEVYFEMRTTFFFCLFEEYFWHIFKWGRRNLNSECLHWKHKEISFKLEVIGFFSKELRDLIFDDLYFLTDMTYFIFLIEPIVTHYKDCMLIWHLTATLITVIDKKITLKVSNIRDENWKILNINKNWKLAQT